MFKGRPPVFNEMAIEANCKAITETQGQALDTQGQALTTPEMPLKGKGELFTCQEASVTKM